MMLRDLDIYMQKNETQPPNYTIHQKKFKMDKDLNISCDIRWIKDLNISFDIIKVLEENIGRKISDVPHNIFTDMSPKGRDIKGRTNKWDFIKIKSFCTARENIIKMKREPTIWENNCR